ncbi:hypothetical protein SAMN05444503_105190 [Pseudomonas sp. BS3767]|uniref:Uncharacterized protein n=1 Tax=Pseudomonas syringae TaxID=317 RepID=A0AB37ZQ87_PSESX|nr:hypothetical protein SAMN05444503_105190 [Pseudomonas sp. BS3767]SDN40184.1 hypothetical protein SAMN05444502_105190 [Pseudomonas sp. BS3759]SDN47913.1 hypothetical protein SAMN05444505_108195 [Pseudomonas syringae]
MGAFEMFWVVAFIFIIIGLIAGHFLEVRRSRSIEEFERKRRDRKAEVERAARKSL